MTTPPRILFAPAPVQVGGGHLMRCLSLATALSSRGAGSIFSVAAADAPLVEHFAPDLSPRLIRPAELAHAVRTRACDAVVIDDYGLVADDERTLRRYGCGVLMVIDDLADRPHVADLLLDPGYGRTTDDYAALLPASARILAGPGYALLRPAFARLRDETRPVRVPPERVFVSFGLSDVDAVSARTMDLLRPLAPAARFDVAVGAGAASLEALQAMAANDAGVVVHVAAPDVAALMAEADIAVGAGGGATWERCCLGLPSLTVVVAENQRQTVEGLAADGALLGADLADPDWEQAMIDRFTALLDADLRRSLSAQAMALCDGRGAERAADALLERLTQGSAAPAPDGAPASPARPGS